MTAFSWLKECVFPVSSCKIMFSSKLLRYRVFHDRANGLPKTMKTKWLSPLINENNMHAGRRTLPNHIFHIQVLILYLHSEILTLHKREQQKKLKVNSLWENTVCISSATACVWTEDATVAVSCWYQIPSDWMGLYREKILIFPTLHHSLEFSRLGKYCFDKSDR